MSKRDPLTSKRRRTERFRFEVADPTDAQQLIAEARLATLRASDEASKAEAERLTRAAQEALDACYGTVVLQALPQKVQLALGQEFAEREAERRAERDAVVKAAEEAGEEPPDEEPEPDEVWTEDSIEVRMIAACDVDGRSPKVWADVLASDEWSLTDRNELYETALRANAPRRGFDLGVLGKG